MAYTLSSRLARLVFTQLRVKQRLPVASFTTCRRLLNNTTDLTQVPDRPDLRVKDILLNDLKNVRSHDRLFKIVHAHCQVMNQDHILQSFKTLFELSKIEMDANTIASINLHPTFERLCIALKKHSRTMDSYDILEALKILVFLEVRGNSAIVQYLLQLLRDGINELNLQQIVFLHFLLGKCEKSHLGESLKLALPLLFQCHLSLQLDHENVSQAVDYLQYATKNNIQEKYINSIISCLVLQMNKLEPKMAVSVIFSLLIAKISWNDHVQYKKLLNYCFDIVSQNKVRISYPDIIRILNGIKTKVSYKADCFYHEGFLEFCAVYPIVHNLDLHNSIQISKILSWLGYTHIELYEYMSDYIVEKPESLVNGSAFVLFNYVNSLAHAYYQPRQWDIIRKLFSQSPIRHSPIVKIPWARYVAQLAILGVYDDLLLNKVFAKEFLSEYLDRSDSMLDNVQILNTYQAVKAFYPSYSGIYPPSDVLERARKFVSVKNTDEVMKACLELAFGEDNFVANHVEIIDGMFVDFVINFDDDGIPMPLPSAAISRATFEDLKIEKKENAICIINFHQGCYSTNCNRLRGSANLLLKILEENEFNVVAISGSDWHNMPANERLPFLVREINSQLAMPISVCNQIT